MVTLEIALSFCPASYIFHQYDKLNLFFIFKAWKFLENFALHTEVIYTSFITDVSNHDHKHFLLKITKRFDKSILFLTFLTFRLSLQSLTRNCFNVKIKALISFSLIF